jgi:hypothetical protein
MHLSIPFLPAKFGYTNCFSEFNPRSVNSSSHLQYGIARVALVVRNFVPSSCGFCGLEAAGSHVQDLGIEVSFVA